MAATLAALAALALDARADPQDAPRSLWTLSAERSWADSRAQAGRTLSPSGVFNTEIGWLKIRDLRPDTGLQLDLAQSWALLADWDRHRPKMVQVRDTIDTFLLGVHYRFR